MSAEHTPGPWDYVPGNENHGPFVTSDFGSTIADCYVMSHPQEASVFNGGPSKPVLFMGEMAEANARLIAAAPDLLEALAAFMANFDPAALVENDLTDSKHADAARLAFAAIAKARAK